jgi:WD40 repeat protein/energy-coupling factor transporter ATP-binding protein EcfA2
MGSVGARIFVSHSSGDNDVTRALAKLLVAEGFESLFVDFDPAQGIPPGRDWERELSVALRRCDVVLAIDGPAWRSSPWCFAEAVLARALGKTIVLLDIGERRTSAPSGTANLTADSQRFSVPELSPESCKPLFVELRRLGVGPSRAFRWDPARAPYPGLSSFQEQDAAVFFGRRDATREVLDLIERVAKYGEKALVLLVGPSGSGKSSLLRAGILPELRKQPRWQVSPLVRGGGGLEEHGELPAATPGHVALVAFDQIDELLTAKTPGAAANLQLLFDVIDGRLGPTLAVGTLRAEALGRFNEHLGYRSERVEKFVVGQLTRADYREIIVNPAEVAGVPVESELVDALLADVAASGARRGETQAAPDMISSDALPLLAVTLRQLWDKRDRAAGLNSLSYQRLGRLDGAIAKRADAVMLASRLDETDLEAVRAAFVSLVRVDREGRYSRRAARLRDLPDRLRSVLDRFVAEGLLVTGNNGDSLELAHEALIRTWPQLASWVSAVHQDLLRIERFEHDLSQWRENPARVLEGLNLGEAEELARRGHQALLSPEAQSLIAVSRTARDQAEARERERALALRVSESLRLASVAREASAAEPESGLLVAWESLLWHRNELSETVFREALARMPAPVQILREATPRVSGKTTIGVADRETLFALGPQGVTDVWDLAGDRRSRFAVPGTGPSHLAAVPDSALLLSYRAGLLRLMGLDGSTVDTMEIKPASEGGAVSLQARRKVGLLHIDDRAWIFSIGDRRIRFERQLALVGKDYRGKRHDRFSNVYEAQLAADGRRFLTQGDDQTTRLWSIDGANLATVRAARDSFASGVFLPDGSFATGTFTGEGALWSQDGGLRCTFKPSAGADLFLLATGPSGVYTTTINRSGIVEIWDSSGTLLSTLPGPKHHIWGAAFSPDGRAVICGSSDWTIRVWDWRAERLVMELHGHQATVNQIVFLPDSNTRFLSADQNHSVRLWSLDTEVLPAHRGHDKAATSLQRLPRGLISSSAEERSCRIWSGATSHALPGEFLGRVDLPGTHDVAIVTRTSDSTVSLSRQEGDTVPREECSIALNLDAHDRIEHALLSPDGRRLILATRNRAELWSNAGKRLGSLIGPHDEDAAKEHDHVVGAGFHPETGAIVTAARNGMVWLWEPDLRLRRGFLVERGSPDPLLSFALDPCGTYVLLGIRDSAQLWTWHGEPARGFRVYGRKVELVSFSPDGSLILTIADNPWRGGYEGELWAREGHGIRPIKAPLTNTSRVMWDPASRYFCAFDSDGGQRFFDRTGNPMGTLAGPAGTYASDTTISAQGDTVATVFSDGIVRVWDIHERRRVMTLNVEAAVRILLTEDGRRLLVSTPAGPIEQHALEISDLFPAAAARIDRVLSPEERERFGIANEPRLTAEKLGELRRGA